MGTMIQRHKLTEEDFRGERFASHSKDLRGNNDMLVLTRPDIILGIHEQYLEAGADIIETNSFSGTTIAQADYALEPFVYELNVEAAKLAKQAADKWTTPDKPRFVAGAMGPTNKTLSISPDVNDPAFRAVTFDQMKDAFAEQVRGLIDGGVDVLLIETIIDTLSAKAAMLAAAEVDPDGKVPIILSATITDRSGRTLVRADDRRVLGVGDAREAARGRDQLRARRPRNAAVPRRALARRNDVRQQLSQCRAAERVRPVRPARAGDWRARRGFCHQRLRQHRRRLLRDDARSHPRHRGTGRRRAGAQDSDGGRPAVVQVAAHAVRRPRSARRAPRQQLPDDRRAHERHRLEEISAADQGRQVRRGRRRGAGAGARRRQPDRRQHGRGPARLRAGDDAFPQSHRHRAGNLASADHDRQLEVVCARSRIEMRTGKARRQFDQLERRRRGLPEEGAQSAAVRRRRGGDGVRRDRPGRHRRAQSGDLLARLQAADRETGLRSDRHHLRPEHPRNCDRIGRAQRVRHQLHRGVQTDQGGVPGRQLQRRRQQPVVLIPRQRRRPRSDSLGVSVPRDQSRPEHGHRERRSADRVRGHPEGSSRARRRHHLQPPA